MSKSNISPVDERIDRGEIYISPKRHPYLGRPCGAYTRNNQDQNGGYCQLRAGHGTDHLGEGRCRFHGGATPRMSGRYSKLKLRKVAELIDDHLVDEKPLDLLPDLAAARALFEDYLNNYEELQEAMKAWYASYKNGSEVAPRPTKIPDMDDARKMLDTISGMVAKVEKIKAEHAISRDDFYRLMTEMGRVVDHCVKNESEKEAVKEAWLQIRLA